MATVWLRLTVGYTSEPLILLNSRGVMKNCVMKNRGIASRNERAYDHKQKEKRIKQQQAERRARRNEKRGEIQ